MILCIGKKASGIATPKLDMHDKFKGGIRLFAAGILEKKHPKR
jgi:hypothetical protein